MKYEDITIVLGVDAKHLNELRFVWSSWMRFKPELKRMPCIVFYDALQVKPEEADFLNEHPSVRLVPWEMTNAESQREKMLTGFVKVPALEVQTPWYLKIDTDVIATAPGEWLKEEWFLPDEHGRTPVFIASSWAYTKPANLMALLDDWADGVPLLAKKPRLNLPYGAQDSVLSHQRITSWLFFGRTDWTRKVAALLGREGRLPYPSQDSFMFYCAKRLRCRFVRARMKEHGWDHRRVRLLRLEQAIDREKTGENQRGDRGVVYYNRGTGCAVRLLVSLTSLRKHYSGPITVLSEGDESHSLCEQIGKTLDVNVAKWEPGVPAGKNAAFLAKTRLNRGTPYEVTVAIDSDTLILGPIDELFDAAENGTFCVAHFANRRTTGGVLSRRIRRWSDIAPNDLDAALEFGPAINTGVIAFTKNASIFEEWYTMAEKGRHHFIPDEVSCQLMLHRHKHQILDGRWNRSCKHDNPNLPGTRIIHYHGKKHCREGLPYHANKWIAVYEEVTRHNISGVRSWTPAGDGQLTRYLKKRSMLRASAIPLPVYKTNLWCSRGHFNQDQGDKYAELCELVKPRNVLETGFCTGRSTACILHNSPTLRRMISIDINLDYKAPHGRRMAALIKGRFPNWDIIESSSRLILTTEFFQREFPQGIDLATIDGDHTYEGCMFDMEAVAPHLTLHGAMIVDDYCSGPPNGTIIESVTQSVDAFLVQHKSEFFGERWFKQGKGFCIIRRIS